MSTYNNLADFSSEGFNVGKDTRVMSYIHGLSDFWVYMFDDASKVNLMMEANAITASDIYNKFLQLTSTISLEGISTLTNAQIKLVLVAESDKVDGSVETYDVDKSSLKFARYLVNRPFLPTTKLENEADYYIDESLGQISFAKPLADLGFPIRTRTDGSKEYALWAVDAKIDDNLIYNYYGKLINVNPSASTDLFKNFVYGMYYLFTQGPNLETVRRGLNLALGIPLARDVETVLEIRKYLNSDQWIVITDRNSYIVPYGLEPTVKEDDLLEVGQEIAQWIEVKDYINDGDWWVNFMLPSHLLPHVPLSVPGGGGVVGDSSPDRYMTEGSYADWLMRNYLKTHTFLVNVKTVGFKNIQNFEQLSDIIREVKPSYTTPIYVWTVPTGEEVIQITEEAIRLIMARERCECITEGIGRFRRDATNPLVRGNCPQYIRMSAPSRLDAIMGTDPVLNQTRSFNGGALDGYIAPARTYSTMSNHDLAWVEAFRTRDQDQYIPKRGLIDFARNYGGSTDGVTVRPLAHEFPDMRMVYLYTTTRRDVEEKYASAGLEVPEGYFITLFKPTETSDSINEHAINDKEVTSYLPVLEANFDYYFERGYWGQFLTPKFGEDSDLSFKPTVTDLRDTDYLAFTLIDDNCYGVFWITSNMATKTPGYFGHEESDVFNVRFNAPISRGGAALGYPFYLTRAGGATISYNSSNGLNEQPINNEEPEVTEITVNYGDSLNPTFPVDRSGKYLNLSRTWK
jgi:hypothetical protein